MRLAELRKSKAELKPKIWKNGMKGSQACQLPNRRKCIKQNW